ncbi:MAG: serine/threonine protein kinase, partial [Candidatus Obscuribacterales bacterium]|nr:serine/threonine protein kinase [Candidatus Obscuribacterales bacterium]
QNRYVAIKMLYGVQNGTSKRALKLQREAKVLANLHHNNVVSLINYALSEDDRPYLVMDYVQGNTLYSEMDSGSVYLSRALNILSQIASAMDYCHSLHLIHRDLKPSNIMLVAEPLNDTVKILDFGIAKWVDQSSNNTTTGSAFSTAAYMSPEQCYGKSVGPASDIYSLGVIMYELFTGRLPICGSHDMQTAFLKCTEDARPINEVISSANYPKSLLDLVSNCLQRKREDRIQDMSTVVQVLYEVRAEVTRRNKALCPAARDRESIVTRLARATQEETVEVVLENPSTEHVEERSQPSKVVLLACALIALLGVAYTSSFFFTANSDASSKPRAASLKLNVSQDAAVKRTILPDKR